MSDATTQTDGIAYAKADGVAVVTFDRPAQRNAITPEMQQAYFRALLDADADPEVHAIVVTGAGKAFCAGADFSRLDSLAADPAARTSIGADTLPRYLPLTLSRPVIAAVNGPAVGLGFVLAVFSDVRFAGASASFSLPFSRLGLVAEYGLSWFLPRLVGLGNASDLLLSGRTIDAAEARGMGLVQHVVPDDELLAAATSYAREIAQRCSPRSVAVIRDQLFSDFDREFRAAFDDSLRKMAASFEAPDVSEGIAAFRERRLPAFPPYVGDRTASQHTAPQ
jgi:enoyl-CoA hydratase/carnithine racemase